MRKIVITISSVLSLILLTFSVFTHAQTSDSQSAQKSIIEKRIQEYEQKLKQVREEKNTLSSQIQYMDTQIYLTELKTQETEEGIKETQKEIELLDNKINGLDSSMDYLSKLVLEGVVAGYKERDVSLFDVLLDSGTANDLITKIKYYQITQNNNQKILLQVQEAKLNFEEQKVLREKKKEELDSLTTKLENQKVTLNTQKQDKQQLLAVTKNDETTYQRLLDEAKRQLAGFRSFVKTAGGGIIGANAFGSGSDGWYYSQRDERWASMGMGSSNDSVLEVGCLITDLAMVNTKNGNTITPAHIASDSQYFFSNTAYMLHPSRFSWGGKKYVNIPSSTIAEEVKNGNPVITGVNAGKYGTHYVVIKAMEGDEYIMHDPYYGPDKKFSDYYSRGSIFVAAVLR